MCTNWSKFDLNNSCMDQYFLSMNKYSNTVSSVYNLLEVQGKERY